MNVLILGAGAREHALGWKIKQSPLAKRIYFAPGNGGTSVVGENVHLDVTKHDEIISFCREQNIDFVIPGPDTLYAAGIVDALTAARILVFGPTKASAQIAW